MNYKIITNEDRLREYIAWLPELEPHEKFYMALLARKKYCAAAPHIQSDKSQLKRVATCKERMFDKIKQMECAVGSYAVKGQTIPQEALALYITVNPRDLKKATLKGIGALARLVETGGESYNPHATMMSQIHKSSSNRRYVIFDLDSKSKEELKEVLDIIGIECKVVETHGGFHIFVPKEEAESIENKRWYTTVANLANVDQSGDLMSAVCGCYQGGWEPRFI